MQEFEYAKPHQGPQRLLNSGPPGPLIPLALAPVRTGTYLKVPYRLAITISLFGRVLLTRPTAWLFLRRDSRR